ncbi:MAG TPA: hypothetical protein VGK05_05145 [Acidimicrobiia bacterium]
MPYSDLGEQLVDEIDFRAVEKELCRLPGISAARIVADSAGRPIEVHVLALPGKRPKQIARDVQSVAMASFGIDLDHRIISVVQLDGEEVTDDQDEDHDEDHEEAVEQFRPRIVAINIETSGLRAHVLVRLAYDNGERAGSAEGTIAAASRPRLVGAATLDAIQQLVPDADRFDLDSAQILRVGANDVAIVALVAVMPPHEEVVSGSAIVHQNQDPSDAVVRAVLDATNRKLSRIE